MNIKLMPGEPWTTLCWTEKVQSHVSEKMLDDKKFLGGFVPTYGPVPLEYCLAEDLECPGPIFEETEVSKEVMKPTSKRNREEEEDDDDDEEEAGPSGKRVRTVAKSK